jgi:acyl-coenzyme A thioesterase PaaI-like protein
MKEEGPAPLVKDRGCFVCGPDNARGLRALFEIDPEGHTAFCRMIVPGWSQGWQDVVHGGILATLLDEACVHASRTLGPLPVTAELKVKFRRAVPVGTEIHIHGEVTERRKRIVQARARIEVIGEVHAEAEAKIFLTEG